MVRDKKFEILKEIENGIIKKIEGDIDFLKIIVFEKTGYFEYFFKETNITIFNFGEGIVRFIYTVDDNLLLEGLKQIYDFIPEKHPYKIAAFINEEGKYALKTFTSEVNIRKMEAYEEKMY